LPAAFALARDVGDAEAEEWFSMEAEGFQSRIPESKGIVEARRKGALKWMKTRGISTSRALTEHGSGLPKRSQLLGQSMIELEMLSKVFASEQSQSIEHLLAGHETIRVVVTVRFEATRWALSVRSRVRDERLAVELFGIDAQMVFTAGGQVLDELRGALTTMRLGSASAAALQARTALIEMGRLYRGPAKWISPIDGREHDTSLGERNALHALIDDLYSRSDESRKELLTRAHESAKVAYRLGSKAKTPAALTSEDCLAVIRGTFDVAWSLALCGGFPLPVRQEVGS
jgi:hypothetical protein